MSGPPVYLKGRGRGRGRGNTLQNGVGKVGGWTNGVTNQQSKNGSKESHAEGWY